MNTHRLMTHDQIEHELEKRPGVFIRVYQSPTTHHEDGTTSFSHVSMTRYDKGCSVEAVEVHHDDARIVEQATLNATHQAVAVSLALMLGKARYYAEVPPSDLAIKRAAQLLYDMRGEPTVDVLSILHSLDEQATEEEPF